MSNQFQKLSTIILLIKKIIKKLYLFAVMKIHFISHFVGFRNNYFQELLENVPGIHT